MMEPSPDQEAPPVLPSVSNIKRPSSVLIITLLLGWGFDFLFWGRPVGINLAIYITACLLGGLALLLANGIKPAFKSLGLIAPFLFFATIAALRLEPLTLTLGITFSLVSLGVLATTYLGGQWMRYSLLDYCANFFLLIGSIFMLPFRFIRGTKINLSNLRQMPIKPVVRGVLLAIPVLIFFSVLLSAADVVFNQQIVNFFHRFDLGRIPEYILRLIIILFWAYALMGVFLHAAQRSGDRKLIGEDKPVIKRFLGFTETSIVLGSVSILFLLFVIVQFRYFFGGEVNIGVEGYTRSEYARSGFSELIAVAFCSLLMILGLGTITRRESDRQKRIFSGLSVGIVALVIVILVSAYQRLNLAIDWHGFSRLRLYPRIFLVWIGILFVAVTVLEILRRERYFALAMLLASLGFGVTISLVNVDASIVRHNVYRTIEGDYININYLTSLSTDAVPGLVKAYLDPVLPEETHNGVGVALVCYLYPTSNKNYSPTDWRSFNYSHWAALKALDSVRTQLEQFVTHRIPGHLFVDTPDHKMQYECAGPVTGQ